MIIDYEPMAGDSIGHACRKAASIAARGGQPVTFDFNGVPVTVRPGESTEAAVARWSAEMERRAEAYRNSPEGKAAAAAAEASRRLAQEQTDSLMAQLPHAVHDLGSLVRWCAAMSQAADHVGVSWDRAGAVRAIEGAGYRANAHVGRPPEAFADPRTTGEYIVGQALACMARGMPPHPVTEMFARKGGFL